mmetsp:Transcript_8975/g.19213  ORF Transcript_8975/g.19213 Transcript_8975/m.19213 type:complete len:756 (+) Transcript_8975:92-2359(+)|eukprot:CAMPEP_0202911800 /NCGR_PEP_ID=MMETSP1392-20130828/55959_1 /ASSEMBLY_ACC=CAM_ASM_000868 /TAXON_ID=225041 /ORGANISM="Chlamydomonas chlamydogama, Strain SAG 11-48b" /LENGTH=755 /DNA_ID=CAMNT_0049602445 /DNA_START=38 /DNA_END=2305 /DNA_ORIENTATION=+
MASDEEPRSKPLLEAPESPRSTGPKWQQAFRAALAEVVGAVSRTAASAQELLSDKDLRRKGAQFLVEGAQRKLQGIQEGFQRNANAIGNKITQSLANKKQLQSLLNQIEKQIATYQHQRQLQQHRRQLVDVQVGVQVYRDMPQEVRSRLWYVLLEVPGITDPLKPIQCRPQDFHTSSAAPGPSNLTVKTLGPGDLIDLSSPSHTPTGTPLPAASAHDNEAVQLAHPLADLPSSPDLIDLGASGPLSSTPPPAASSAGPNIHKNQSVQTSGVPKGSSEAGSLEAGMTGAAAGPNGLLLTSGGGGDADVDFGAGSFMSQGPDDWEVVASSESGRFDRQSNGVVSTESHRVTKSIIGQIAAGTLSGTVHEPESDLSETEREAIRNVADAMANVPWVPGSGIPDTYSPDCRFATLNEMTAGQEEVDDIITRDINRTFPEHPFFSVEHGQQALFRVLKAYSLHDLEVGYCQGMAFAAGVLLMYLPDEPSFRLFCKLMDPEGPNLRRLYLPGLDALKLELTRFEVLMDELLPELHRHLQEYGVPPVLYVSQWLMTAFATPFQPMFCARLIDIMLQDGNDYILMRVALAIMAELEAPLLQLDDFEHIITHLKVAPAKWNVSMMRKVLRHALTSTISDQDMVMAGREAAARMLSNPDSAIGEFIRPSAFEEPGPSCKEDASDMGASSSQQHPLDGATAHGGACAQPAHCDGVPAALDLGLDSEFMRMVLELNLLGPEEGIQGSAAGNLPDDDMQRLAEDVLGK